MILRCVFVKRTLAALVSLIVLETELDPVRQLLVRP